MRPHLNERASNELLEIMRHYDHGSPNHTLNILISSLHDSLFKTKRPSPSDEVNFNDYSSTEKQ